MAKKRYTAIKCLICGKLLKNLLDDNTPPENGAWNGGMVDKMVAGYGSGFDMTTFIVGVCDECIKEKIMEKRMIIKEKYYA